MNAPSSRVKSIEKPLAPRANGMNPVCMCKRIFPDTVLRAQSADICPASVATIWAACPGITRRQLQQMAIWHFREETFTLASPGWLRLSMPPHFSAAFGSHSVSSSDGQHIHFGDGGEVADGVNGRYSTNPIISGNTAWPRT
ncbi:Tn3 family transposase [Ensifer aridi]|uniref:Tn3 family transposase n=1 Tax=Ensifer aridi TaxID=1708715 RepID=UPI0011117E9E